MEYLWDRLNKTAIGIYLGEVARRGIRKHLLPDGGLALNIGCGTRSFNEELDTNNYTTIDIDLDFLPLSILKKRDQSAILMQATAQTMPFSSNCFSLIVAVGVLDYLPDKNLFYSEAWRILRPGGRLLFTLTNKKSIKGCLYGTYKFFAGERHGRTYYKKNLQEGLNEILEHQFSIISLSGYNWNVLPVDCDNNLLVSLFAGMERLFHLQKFPHYSPLVFVAVEKKDAPTDRR